MELDEQQGMNNEERKKQEARKREREKEETKNMFVNNGQLCWPLVLVACKPHGPILQVVKILCMQVRRLWVRGWFRGELVQNIFIKYKL